GPRSEARGLTSEGHLGTSEARRSPWNGEASRGVAERAGMRVERAEMALGCQPSSFGPRTYRDGLGCRPSSFGASGDKPTTFGPRTSGWLLGFGIRHASRRSGRAAAFVGLSQAFEDEPIQVEVEPDVFAHRLLAGHELELALAPQQQSVEHAAQGLAHRVLHLVRGRDAGGHQARSEPFTGACGRRLENAVQGLGRNRAAMHQELTDLDGGAAGAREHRLAALDEDVGALAGTLELEASGGLGERKELEDFGGEEVAQV